MAQVTKRSLSLLQRYGLYLFIPISLAAAYIYIGSQAPKYKVTATIALRGIPPDSAVKDMRSKYLVSKVLDQLPFQASYFFADAPAHEILPDSSPVKLAIKSVNDAAPQTWIAVQAGENGQLELTRGDTSAYYKFNEPINESYGKFSVAQNPSVKDAGRVVNIKIEPRALVLNQFYNNLIVSPEQTAGVLKFTVVTGNAQKGAEFLNTLFRLYSQGMDRHVERAENTVTRYDTIVKPGKDVSALKDEAAGLTRQIERLRAQSANTASVAPVRRAPLDKSQAKIYGAVDSYIKRPIDEFVQVPYVDEIEDPDLNDQVNEFNEAELNRQHLTSPRQIDSVNRKLMTLRSNIVEQIHVYLKNEGSVSNRALSRENLAAQIQSKERELAQLNKDIESAGTKTYTVVKAGKVNSANTENTAGLVLLDKPEDNMEAVPVNSLLIYGIALLAGIFFPFAGWVARSARRNSSAHQFPGKEKLSEKLSDIFAVKQID